MVEKALSGLRNHGCELIFLDQSIIGKVIDGHSSSIRFSEKFDESLHHLGILQRDGRYFAHTSELAVVELAGIRRQVLIPFDRHKRQIDRLIRRKTDISEIKRIVLEFYMDRVREIPEASVGHILQKFEEKQASYSSERGKMILDHIAKKVVGREGFQEDLVLALAFDRMYGHRYPEEHLKNLSLSFLLDIAINISMGRDFNQCRGMQKVVESMIAPEVVAEYAQSEGEDAADVLRNTLQLLRDVRFDDQSDLGDMEVAHYSVLGKHQGEALLPVMCFTVDDEDQTRKRAALVRSFSEFVFGHMREVYEERGEDFPKVRPRHGAIGYVSGCGEVTKIEAIESIPKRIPV